MDSQASRHGQNRDNPSAVKVNDLMNRIDKCVVEAAGVELITMLIARKLLIPRTATTAKKASLPDPLYVYCTKIFLALRRLTWEVSHKFARSTASSFRKSH